MLHDYNLCAYTRACQDILWPLESETNFVVLDYHKKNQQRRNVEKSLGVFKYF